MIRELDIDSKLFIRGYYIDPKICDKINQWFTDLPEEYLSKGVIGASNGGTEVNTSIKDTIETTMPDPMYSGDMRETFETYCKQVNQCFTQYNETYNNYPISSGTYRFLVTPPQIQRYNKNGSFSKLHCEMYTSNLMGFRRHLVYMTYLDDIEEGGGTEFPLQNFTSKSEKGLTLIWPAGWTHMHRGVPAPNDVKTIITSWAHFDIDYENIDSFLQS